MLAKRAVLQSEKVCEMARELPGQYPAWVRTPEETAAHYGVCVDGGLTAKQVEEQRAKFGWNELEKPSGKPLWKLVLEQFDDMLVKVVGAAQDVYYSECSTSFLKVCVELDLPERNTCLLQVLLLAAVVSFLLALFEEGSAEEGIRAFIEPAVILLILILNAIVGVWQESNAEAALDALKDSLSETATVLRDNHMVNHPGSNFFGQLHHVCIHCEMHQCNMCTFKSTAWGYLVEIRLASLSSFFFLLQIERKALAEEAGGQA